MLKLIHTVDYDLVSTNFFIVDVDFLGKNHVGITKVPHTSSSPNSGLFAHRNLESVWCTISCILILFKLSTHVGSKWVCNKYSRIAIISNVWICLRVRSKFSGEYAWEYVLNSHEELREKSAYFRLQFFRFSIYCGSEWLDQWGGHRWRLGAVGTTNILFPQCLS